MSSDNRNYNRKSLTDDQWNHLVSLADKAEKMEQMIESFELEEERRRVANYYWKRVKSIGAGFLIFSGVMGGLYAFFDLVVNHFIHRSGS